MSTTTTTTRKRKRRRQSKPSNNIRQVSENDDNAVFGVSKHSISDYHRHQQEKSGIDHSRANHDHNEDAISNASRVKDAKTTMNGRKQRKPTTGNPKSNNSSVKRSKSLPLIEDVSSRDLDHEDNTYAKNNVESTDHQKNNKHHTQNEERRLLGGTVSVKSNKIESNYLKKTKTHDQTTSLSSSLPPPPVSSSKSSSERTSSSGPKYLRNSSSFFNFFLFELNMHNKSHKLDSNGMISMNDSPKHIETCNSSSDDSEIEAIENSNSNYSRVFNTDEVNAIREDKESKWDEMDSEQLSIKEHTKDHENLKKYKEEKEKNYQNKSQNEKAKPGEGTKNNNRMTGFESMYGTKESEYRDRQDSEQIRRTVYNSISIPVDLERFLLFGFFVCLDSFLFFITFLPLRIIIALYCIIFNTKFENIQNTQICDILKGCVLLMNVYFLNVIDYSLIYHFVRGESALKLYVMYNMLEMFEKLCAGFAQDIQDSFFFSIIDYRMKQQDASFRESFTKFCHVILGIIIYICYLFIHTSLQLVRSAALNVALNSSSSDVLVTLLISNNFVEVKANVFKKFSEDNLFQVSCHDAIERFQLFIFSLCIWLQNMHTHPFTSSEVYWLLCILVAEVVVDAIKHAFITKFNNIKTSVYRTFKKKLCEDLSANTHYDSFLDNTHFVSRRMGFIPMPLLSIMIKVFIQTQQMFLSEAGGLSFTIILVYLLGFCCLILIKILLSLVIVGYAAKRTFEEKSFHVEPKEKFESVK